MTRRVWVLPPTGPPEPEGGGRAGLPKNSADHAGIRRLRWHRTKAKKAAPGASSSDAGAAPSSPPDLGTGISSAPDP